MAATIKGIDISMYQTNVDFAKVKAAGYSFVIIRCNNWDNKRNCVVKDLLFETHYKKGKSNGVLALKQLLMLAGYKLDNNGTFGDGTLKAVNALLKKWGYSQNGIAGANFIKKLSATIK